MIVESVLMLRLVMNWLCKLLVEFWFFEWKEYIFDSDLSKIEGSYLDNDFNRELDFVNFGYLIIFW